MANINGEKLENELVRCFIDAADNAVNSVEDRKAYGLKAMAYVALVMPLLPSSAQNRIKDKIATTLGYDS